MKIRKPKIDKLCESGNSLVGEKHTKSDDIRTRIASLQEKWKILNNLVASRKKQLDEAAEAYQVSC